MTELHTERLHLRTFRQSDFAAHAQISADPEVMRYILPGPPSRVDAWWQMARYIGHWELLGYGMWAVIERNTGNHIGRTGFLEPEGGLGFEMGWALARTVWGKGYALEGAQAALNYGFTQLKRSHVVCVIHPQNQRSIRVAERLGAALEGCTDVSGTQFQVYGVTAPPPTAA